jgi:hypothetical protein
MTFFYICNVLLKFVLSGYNNEYEIIQDFTVKTIIATHKPCGEKIGI